MLQGRGQDATRDCSREATMVWNCAGRSSRQWGGGRGVIMLLATWLAGCASFRTLGAGVQDLGTQRRVMVRELYRDSAFSRQDLARQGVTCLPARLSFGHETYGHVL